MQNCLQRAFQNRWLAFLGTGLLLASASAPGAYAGVFYPDGATTLHFAFEGSPNGDRPIIRPPEFYHADDGFGFVDSPDLIGTSGGVTAPKHFRFDVNLPPGNYEVSVTFGGIRDESVATVKAEGRRPVMFDAKVAGGQSGSWTFPVNVRPGGPAKDGNDLPLDADGRLNLEFDGTNPTLMKLDIKPAEQVSTVYLLGDETVADSDSGAAAGWGQMLQILFKYGEVAVSNWAAPGETAKGAIDDHRLDALAKTLKAGDTVLVQLSAKELADSADDDAAKAAPLKTIIDEARKHGATVALLTPPPDRGGVVARKTPFAASAPPKWLTELSASQKAPLIDLNSKAAMLLNRIGAEEAAKGSDAVSLQAVFAGGTNFSAYGALEMAKLVAAGIKEQKLDLAAHLTDNIESSLDPSKFPANLGFATASLDKTAK